MIGMPKVGQKVIILDTMHKEQINKIAVVMQSPSVKYSTDAERVVRLHILGTSEDSYSDYHASRFEVMPCLIS